MSKIIILLLFIYSSSILIINCETININASLWIDSKSKLGEGSIWDSENKLLYWIDIEGKKLHVYNPQTFIDSEYSLPSRPGTVVVRSNSKKGEVIIALEKIGVVNFNYLNGDMKVLAVPEKLSTNRYNDGKCDTLGRFWVGSMSLKNGQPPEAKLYRINNDLSVSTMLENVSISNGIVWSSDSMYYIDTPKAHVQRFPYNKQTGDTDMSRSSKNVAIYESPDGMTIDSLGRIWIAHYNGGCVTCWDPNNHSKGPIYKIVLPVQIVTSCAFAEDNLSTLYITTGENGKQGSGGLYRVDLSSYGIKGLPTNYCSF